jgi:hypothetical protein
MPANQDQSHQLPDPFRGLVEAFSQLGKHINSNVHQIQRNMQQPFAELGAHASNIVHHLHTHMERQLQSPSPLQPLMAVRIPC